MAGGVEEGNEILFRATRVTDLVCSDVLGDAAGFFGAGIGLTDIIEQGRFAVVDVPHNSDDWWSLNDRR